MQYVVQNEIAATSATHHAACVKQAMPFWLSLLAVRFMHKLDVERIHSHWPRNQVSSISWIQCCFLRARSMAMRPSHASGPQHPDPAEGSLDPAVFADVCKVCQTCVVRKKGTRYCRECRNDVDACKFDAGHNGWILEFEEAATNEITFRALMLQYQVECPTRGRGSRRSAFMHKMYFSSASSHSCCGPAWMPHKIKTRPSSGSGQANINSIVGGRQQSVELSRKRCRSDSEEDSDLFAGPGPAQACLSGQDISNLVSIPRASGTSRLRCVCVCVFILQCLCQ